MTAWDELLAKSTAVTGSDAWEHLVSPCLGGGGGPGVDRLVPYDDLVLDIEVKSLSLDIAKKDLTIDIQHIEIDTTIEGRYLTVDIDTTNKEIDNACE